MKKGDILYIIIPCYNEQEVLPETSRRIKEKMNELIDSGSVSEYSKVVFVDDGSSDATWEIIHDLHQENTLFSGLKLSRNRGHQNALLAGLMTVRELCDVTVSIDSDLQDDLDAIDGLLDKYFSGNDIVYGVRKDRSSDTTVKRSTAMFFYKTITSLGVECVFNHADCRLMSSRALAALSEFKEINLFLRGMVPLLGFKSDIVTYRRAPRFAGESKYPFGKMLQLAVNGITSFSITPLRIVFFTGLIFSIISFCSFLLYIILIISGIDITSFLWVISSIWFSCGLILLSLGIVGEYVGKAFEEVKARPRYIVETFLHDNE